MKHRSAHSTTLSGAVSRQMRFAKVSGSLLGLKQSASVLAGDAQGGGSPLVGGVGGTDACHRSWLASSVLPAWGEPSPPRLVLGGNGKGDQIPCCGRLIRTGRRQTRDLDLFLARVPSGCGRDSGAKRYHAASSSGGVTIACCFVSRSVSRGVSALRTLG